MKTAMAIVGGLIILACLGAGILLVLGIALTGGDEATAPVQSYVIGDIINTSDWGDDWTITVHSVHYPTGGDWRPAEGNRFVMLDLEVVNASDDSQVLSSISAYNLKDAANHEYDNWITSAAPGEEPAGDFAPGEAKRGPVVFQVPSDAGGFVFVFEPSTLGSERVFVHLD